MPNLQPEQLILGEEGLSSRQRAHTHNTLTRTDRQTDRQTDYYLLAYPIAEKYSDIC